MAPLLKPRARHIAGLVGATCRSNDRLISGLALVIALVTMLAALSACASAGQARWQQLPRKVVNHTAFRHYATVTRIDGSRRDMLINEVALQRWQPGQSLPPDTLIVMQTWLTQTESTSFTKRMAADGGFDYGSFDPAQPSFATQTNPECASCHEVSEDAPGTFTLPLLDAAVAQGRPMTAQCDRAGRIPCEAELYRHFTPAH